MRARISEGIEGALDHRQQREVARQALRLDFVRNVVQVALRATEHAREVVGIALQPLDLAIDARMVDLRQRELAADARDDVAVRDRGRQRLDRGRRGLEFLGRRFRRFTFVREGDFVRFVDDLLDRQRAGRRGWRRRAAGRDECSREERGEYPETGVSHRNVSFQLRISANTATGVDSTLPARRSAADLTSSCRHRRKGLTRFSSSMVEGNVGRPSALRPAARLT